MVEEGGVLLPDHFSPEFASSPIAPPREGASVPEALLAALGGEALDPAVRELEYLLVTRALVRYGGNITHAARALGLSRQGLMLKKRRLGID
jgi:DNA-binding NtrC family response regulator